MSEALVVLMVIIGTVGLLGYFWLKRVNAQLEQALIELVTQLEEQMIGLDIEVDNGLYYCYNTADKQFICQGATAREIVDQFQTRYPNKLAYLAGNQEDPVVKELVAQLLRLKDEASHSQ
jgi:pyruvate/2-oxoacid:ferredoxin oxidoreductase alpha subunit